ncbi:hypothetical protein CCO04_19725 [Pimelobacter sp. 30-1]|nr:hypothetical protein [Pimelobacter sp. 30-1]
MPGGGAHGPWAPPGRASARAPLVALTTAVAEALPEHPPCGGAFDGVELWSGPAPATAPDDSWHRGAPYDLG